MYKVYCDSYLIFDDSLKQLKIYNPKVNLEVNKTGSFTFTIYPNHPYFSQLKKLKSIITVYQDKYLLFRGRILNYDEDFHNEWQVTCEGELAFLLDSVQRPYDFMSDDKHTTITELFTFFINNHNSQVDSDHQFTVGNITVTDPNDYIVRSDSTYLNTWESIEQKLINTHGGYLQIRHENDVNYIDYLSDFSAMGNQTIKFGKNLIDLTKNIKGEDIATAIIPLGAKISEDSDERLTIKSVNDDVDYVYNADAVALYGWIFKSVTWDDVTEASNLLRKGEQYLADSINTVTSIELSAVDLAGIDQNINAFHLGTYVKVESTPHSVDQFFRVEKQSIDLLKPDSNKLTLGATFKSFTEEQRKASVEYNQFITQTENNFSNINGAIQQVDERIYSEILQASDEITAKVSQNVYLKDEVDTMVSSVSTQLTQTTNSFEMQFNNFQTNIDSLQTNTDAQFSNISKYIRFVDGNIILGEEGNELTLRIENDKIAFIQNNYEIAYWENKKFYAVDGEFINSLKLGKFAFVPRSNGNLSFLKVVT